MLAGRRRIIRARGGEGTYFCFRRTGERDSEVVFAGNRSHSEKHTRRSVNQPHFSLSVEREMAGSRTHCIVRTFPNRQVPGGWLTSASQQRLRLHVCLPRSDITHNNNSVSPFTSWVSSLEPPYEVKPVPRCFHRSRQRFRKCVSFCHPCQPSSLAAIDLVNRYLRGGDVTTHRAPFRTLSLCRHVPWHTRPLPGRRTSTPCLEPR